DGGREEELRDGRAKDAAPCAANWNVGVGSHAATVRPGPNRPVTARQRFANGPGVSLSLATHWARARAWSSKDQLRGQGGPKDEPTTCTRRAGDGDMCGTDPALGGRQPQRRRVTCLYCAEQPRIREGRVLASRTKADRNLQGQRRRWRS